MRSPSPRARRRFDGADLEVAFWAVVSLGFLVALSFALAADLTRWVGGAA